jgi:DNA-binding transcriptional MerR regulator
MQETKTITEVCKMLGMTSRTVRFYEQCGLISTTRQSTTAPRRLDEPNIERLRKIRFLRKLGLSIEEISGVIDSDEKAAALIRQQTAELSAEITSMGERIRLLEEVLAAVEKGGNIYNAADAPSPPDNPENLHTAAEVTRLLAEGKFAELSPYFNSENKEWPVDFISNVWNSHIKPCGKFISSGEQSMDGETIINRLNYEKLGVIIRMNVCGGLVATIFLQYFKK